MQYEVAITAQRMGVDELKRLQQRVSQVGTLGLDHYAAVTSALLSLTQFAGDVPPGEFGQLAQDVVTALLDYPLDMQPQVIAHWAAIIRDAVRVMDWAVASS